jgi:hypothetical protein
MGKRCKHIYKEKRKYYQKNFNLVSMSGKQYNNSLSKIGVVFFECRYCNKIKDIRIHLQNHETNEVWRLFVANFWFRKVFFNDNILVVSSAKKFLNDILKRCFK